MILSNVGIQKALDEGRLVIDPEPSPRKPTSGEPECPYQTSAVDLRLGKELSVYDGRDHPVQIDLRNGGFATFGGTVMKPVEITEDQGFTLKPRRFILGQTHERIELPLFEEESKSLAARVEGKSSYARCGLLEHFTAPTIHAGYTGKLALDIITWGEYPILMFPEMPICQLIIEEVRGVPFRNDSQFQSQSHPTGHR